MAPRPIIEKIKRSLQLERAVRFVWQAGPGWAVASVVLVMLQGLLPLLALYLVKLIVDAVVGALAMPEATAAFPQVAMLLALAGGTALLTSAVGILAASVNEAQAIAVTDYMYDVLHRKSMSVDLAYYENPSYFDTLHRAQQEGPYRPTRIVNGLLRLTQNSVSLLAMVGLLMAFHWAAALLLFCGALPGVLVKIRFADKMYAWQRRRTQLERKSYYFHSVLTDDTHAKELRLFNLGRLFQTRFSDIRRTLRREKTAILKKRSAADLAAQSGAVLAMVGTSVFIAWRAINGLISVGDMIMYFQAFQRGLTSLKNVLGGMADLYENHLFLTHFYEFMDIKPRVISAKPPQPFPPTITRGLGIEKVCFQYPASNARALTDVSLVIKPDEIVALVGENGSGKTTLVKLLCRLYDPTQGRITLDGVDLKAFDLEKVRGAFSVIFQDYARYHLTALENIWLGDAAAPQDVAKVHAAARKSGVHDAIAGLPRGYDTVLGRRFAGGREISVGEWQKIALARAFLRPAPFVVLDEPTTSLDARTEFAVFKRFRELVKGRSAVLISHRFSTVRLADRIYVFQGGRIVEAGAHADLMQSGGQYAAMYAKQAGAYR